MVLVWHTFFVWHFLLVLVLTYSRNFLSCQYLLITFSPFPSLKAYFQPSLSPSPLQGSSFLAHFPCTGGVSPNYGVHGTMLCRMQASVQAIIGLRVLLGIAPGDAVNG